MFTSIYKSHFCCARLLAIGAPLNIIETSLVDELENKNSPVFKSQEYDFIRNMITIWVEEWEELNMIEEQLNIDQIFYTLETPM